MNAADAITIPAWDETESNSDIGAGTALTFKIPKALIFRKIFFWLEGTNGGSGGDLRINADILLTLDDVPKCVLPAAWGNNAQDNTKMNKSIWSLFTGVMLETAVPQPGDTANLIIAKRYFNTPGYTTNVVTLNARRIACHANRFTMVIRDFTAAVTGFHAAALVLSSNSSY